MLTASIQAAMKRAHYEILADNEGYYGNIPGFQGVWANAQTLEECREELREVLEDWILFRLSRKLKLPSVNGVKLRVAKVA